MSTTAGEGGSRDDRPLFLLDEPTWNPPPKGSARTIHTHCGVAGGQGRSPERVARDGSWVGPALYLAVGFALGFGVAAGWV